MKKTILFLLALISVSVSAADFIVTSATIKNGSTLTNKHVFNSFGCKGENLSPALKWENAPAGTKSFAVTVYDPDGSIAAC